MLVTCNDCSRQYDLPDDRLPYGKRVSFPCPFCKSKVRLDLRNLSAPAGKPPSKVEQDVGEEDLKSKIIRRIQDLPPMPKVLFKARQILTDPDSSFKDITEVIETDQAIAAMILKVANSAYYGMSGMVRSIHQATVVLGYKALEEVVTMASASGLMGSRLKGYNVHAGQLWRHSLAVSLGARQIAQKRNPPLENDAFSAGLLHDAGKLALDHYVVENKAQVEAVFNQTGSYLACERKVLGCDHTEIAHALCAKWNLPASHVAAIRYHHSPEDSDGDTLAHMVHVANHVAGLAQLSASAGSDSEALDAASMDALRLKDVDLVDLTEAVTRAVDDISNSLSA